MLSPLAYLNHLLDSFKFINVSLILGRPELHTVFQMWF